MTLPSARTPVVDRDKATNAITTGKILGMNASSLVRAMRGVTPRSFGWSPCVAPLSHGVHHRSNHRT